jgi:hypothetical protein
VTTDEPKFEKCWCCPPNQMFFAPGLRCQWPNCVCGSKPNPNPKEDES